MATLDQSTVWTVLNSSFALWFLSSVVITGMTTIYTLYKKKQTDQSEQAANARRLNTEMGNRIAEGIIAMHLDRKRIEHGKTFYPGAVYCEALLYLNNRVTADNKALDFSTYPDYRWRSFRSLIFELSAVVARSDIPALRTANSTYEKLVDLADDTCMVENYSQPPDMGKTLNAAKESATILESLRTYRPWKSRL
jgi:hypothetical protein